jgi:hypothetical protein
MYTTRKEARLNGATRYFTGKPCPKKHIAFRDTTSGGCIECAYEYKKVRYHTKTKAYQNAKSKLWRIKNKKELIAYNLEYRLKNPEYYSKWKQENKGLVNAATYKRRTAKLNRMPLWADKNKIKELYKLAQIKTKETGFSWHVDHIIPLQGELVSGLHVFNNLQVISGIDNIKKHNKYEVL